MTALVASIAGFDDFGASDRRKKFVKKLAERVAGKGRWRRGMFSTSGARATALSNIYKREKVKTAKGRPLFRRSLTAEEWGLFVRAYARHRPCDKNPQTGKKFSAKRCSKGSGSTAAEAETAEPTSVRFRPLLPAQIAQQGLPSEDTSTMTPAVPPVVITGADTPGKLGAAVSKRLKELDGYLSWGDGLTDDTYLLLRAAQVQARFARFLAGKASLERSGKRQSAVLRAAIAVLEAPITSESGGVSIGCSAGGAALFGLGYLPGAAYDSGQRYPQSPAGYVPTAPAVLMRNALQRDVIVPTSRPGAVVLPFGVRSRIPDQIAMQQPVPPFAYPTAPALAAPSVWQGRAVVPIDASGAMIPAAAIPSNGIAQNPLPATQRSSEGNVAVTGMAGMAGFGDYGASDMVKVTLNGTPVQIQRRRWERIQKMPKSQRIAILSRIRRRALMAAREGGRPGEPVSQASTVRVPRGGRRLIGRRLPGTLARNAQAAQAAAGGGRNIGENGYVVLTDGPKSSTVSPELKAQSAAITLSVIQAAFSIAGRFRDARSSINKATKEVADLASGGDRNRANAVRRQLRDAMKRPSGACAGGAGGLTF